MGDVSILGEDWFGRIVTAAVTGVTTLTTTVFVTRKNAEAALMERVNQRVEQMFGRYDAQIARLEKALDDDRKLCDRQLAEMRAEIDKLMKGPVAAYSDQDIAHGAKSGRAARARQPRIRRKP